MTNAHDVTTDRYIVTITVGPYAFEFTTWAENANHAENEVRTLISATGGSTAGVTFEVELYD
ncbi:hypothetical protein ACFFQW_36010 [Umezawaea endophytica]|uniref:Uncharacterized protein n=1 Tax=Umezawaea endophytica TaxID=1654476 RepID=A0A9X3AFS1_9PSEU|nr:hypothetical protein [Umezawaea endophytica]MCS7477510.1 hypothetical protein [Umezawaea endophytica]